MSTVKITQDEAERLLNMIKNTLVSEINFPSKGESKEFRVKGEKRQDVFAINIFR